MSSIRRARCPVFAEPASVLAWGMAWGALGMLVLLSAVIAAATRERSALSYAGAMLVVLGLAVLVDGEQAGPHRLGVAQILAVAVTLVLGAGLALTVGRVRRERERLELALRQRVDEERQRWVVTKVDWLSEEIEADLLEPQLREEERHLRHRLYTDLLLDVPNRRYIEEQLVARLSAALGAGEQLGVAVVRLADLGRVNAEHGRWAGDVALIGFARHLKELMQGADAAERYGRLDGAHFLILSPALPDEDALARWEAQTRAALPAVVPLEDAAGEVKVQIGFARAPRDGRSLSALTAHAHAALGAASGT